MKKQEKLYNIIFPIWFLVLFPLTWIVVIPANYIIDSLIVHFVMKKHQIPDLKYSRRKIIFKVVCFGFLSDIIGGIFMFSVNFLPVHARWWFDNLINPVMYNPFESIFSFLWVVAAMIIASAFIYLLNYNFSFKKLDVDEAFKKDLSLKLAIFTTPILFLIPSTWIY